MAALPSGLDSDSLRWDLGGSVHVRPFTEADAPAVHDLIRENRAHLDRWLRWSNAVKTMADIEGLIAEFRNKQAKGDGFHSGIWVDEELAGGVVCWYIHPLNRSSEIGYWLGERFTGRGLATRAAARAAAWLIEEAGVNRIEMQCGVENLRSRAIPERLGFRLEGIRRQSHRIGDRFLDHCIYGLLAADQPGETEPWRENAAPPQQLPRVKDLPAAGDRS